MRSLRVLVAGSFNSGALENFYVDGFKKQGLSTDTFDITKDYYPVIGKSIFNKVLNKVRPELFFTPINKNLLAYTEKKRYDIILVFKGLTLYPSTIEALKQHTGVICCYNPDHPFKFYSEGSGNKYILDSIGHYDVYFSYAKKITAALQQTFSVTSYTIPFGYDSTLSGAGSSINCKGKIAFIGAYDSTRAKQLEHLNFQNLIIYGEEKWQSRASALKPYFSGTSIYGNDYAAACSTANGVLNFLREQNIVEGSHNMRSFEVPGYGGVLISNRTEEQEEYFEEGKEAIYFDNIEDLRSKLKYLSTNESVVKRIKTAAKERSIRSNYAYFFRSQQLMDCLQAHIK